MIFKTAREGTQEPVKQKSIANSRQKSIANSRQKSIANSRQKSIANSRQRRESVMTVKNGVWYKAAIRRIAVLVTYAVTSA